MNVDLSPTETDGELPVEIGIEITSGCEGLIPDNFKLDPIGYFETQGLQIKSGELELDDAGNIREDPTAVRDLPAWIDREGVSHEIVGKRVNLNKGKVATVVDPFYEYRMMELVRSVGLPAPKPIAKVSQSGGHLIIMERVPGIRWSRKGEMYLRAQGYTEDDVTRLKQQAEVEMESLHVMFDRAGINRPWELKDMVIDIDTNSKEVRGITPTDWERTTIDQFKLAEYKKAAENSSGSSSV